MIFLTIPYCLLFFQYFGYKSKKQRTEKESLFLLLPPFRTPVVRPALASPSLLIKVKIQKKIVGYSKRIIKKELV